MSSEILTIDCEPGSITQTTLPSGAVRVSGRKFVLKPPPPVVEVKPNTIVITPDSGSLSAFQQAPPGSTVLLKGDFGGAFNIATKGVTFTSYPGQRARFFTAGPSQARHILTVAGENNIVRDVEIACVGADRSKEIGTGVVITGPRNKVINCDIHDCGSGIGAWSTAIDAEIYGNVILNNGWQGAPPDRGHGHAIYAQGLEGTKLIEANIIGPQFGYGIHCYSQQGDIRGFDIAHNIIFDAGTCGTTPSHEPNILVGGYRPADRVRVRNNYLYHGLHKQVYNTSFYFSANDNGGLIYEGNYVAGGNIGAEVRGWRDVTLRGNTFITAFMLLRLLPGPASSPFTVESNRYVQVGNLTPNLLHGAMGAVPFATWQQHYDKVGSFRRVENATELPTVAAVIPNRYEAGRANVCIFNWKRQASAPVDLSSALKPGEAFQVFNVADLSKPVLTGVFNGGAVALPTPGEMNAYLVRKVS